MAPTIAPIETSTDCPTSTTVVIIGGGIIGLTAALTLAERGVAVTVLEKGRIAGEQSSRNLGWIRKTNRHGEDVPLALASDRLWAAMAERTGCDVGYRQSGIMFLSRTPEQLAEHQAWLDSVSSLSLDSRILSAREIEAQVPGGQGHWAGALFTPSDGYAEPTLASSAIAQAAMTRGAVIIEHCAVRNITRSGGKVSGVVTERGEIRCDQVLLAGGMGSRRFLGNIGISLPTLPLVLSVFRTGAMNGPTDAAVGGPDFSFRKHKDGGFIVTQRGALDAPLTLDHLKIGAKYLSALRSQRGLLRISLGKHFWRDLMQSRHWKNGPSPFEQVRTIDPPINEGLNQEAYRNLSAAWPVFQNMTIEESWAGMIDITPDSNPVIDAVPNVPGLTLATGFSGHGFGTSPAAGQLAADLVMNNKPIIDPHPYRFGRF
ncbi:D-amino-acid oxidase [Terasakiispira papahanaumokuakeensis]|uniref:D-amino-acid oxidase n=1 Tax=Terasakiispira papahanaumokuakeensis TaxID=197479 RepID=A0A1E2V5N5_9GAMM|nr:FAD-binding oxidoreductase [Terasakiispira papahanaumokuakeensis]ODC02301.1 D-amino-acid oxidase [Terasakiispira papahanaumokuakeensis]